MVKNQHEAIVPLYRVENPNIPASPDGKTSHADLVGQSFTPDLDAALLYLHKATRSRGRRPEPAYGAQLVVAQVPRDQLDTLNALHHPIVEQLKMDIEPNSNYIIPRDGDFPMATIPLDPLLDGMQGKLHDGRKLIQARDRVAAHVGRTSLE